MQTHHSLVGIKGLLLLYPAVTLFISALIIAIWYDLTDAHCNHIVADLHLRRAKAVQVN
jgi:GPH family glycoside/pentoside/hexuronide:cation symporter